MALVLIGNGITRTIDNSTVIFEDVELAGNAVQYFETTQHMEDSFPPGGTGVSSFIVTGGVWSLYRDTKLQDRITIEHRHEFGKGKVLYVGDENNDDTWAIKHVRE
jgi:hypothetical protein